MWTGAPVARSMASPWVSMPALPARPHICLHCSLAHKTYLRTGLKACHDLTDSMHHAAVCMCCSAGYMYTWPFKDVQGLPGHSSTTLPALQGQQQNWPRQTNQCVYI